MSDKKSVAFLKGQEKDMAKVGTWFSREHWNNIERHKQEFIYGEYFVTTLWCKDDIRHCAKESMGVEITETEVDEVKWNLINKHDPQQGTHWLEITTWIETVISERKEVN